MVLIRALIICLVATSVYAGGFISANKAIVFWEPVTTMEDGLPIKFGDVSYNLWERDYFTRMGEKAIITSIGETEILIEDKNVVKEYGVQAVLKVNGVPVSNGKVAWMRDFPDTPDGISFYGAMGATLRIGAK